jgi:hypothetical protein
MSPPYDDHRTSVTGNAILGVKVWFPAGGRVTAIGMNDAYQEANQQFYLAIYSDSPSGPQTRQGPAVKLMSSGGTARGAIPHTPEDHTDLDPMTWYWIVATSGDLLALEECTADSPGATWVTGDFPFNELPPTLAPTANVTTFAARPNAPSLFVDLAVDPQ